MRAGICSLPIICSAAAERAGLDDPSEESGDVPELHTAVGGAWDCAFPPGSDAGLDLEAFANKHPSARPALENVVHLAASGGQPRRHDVGARQDEADRAAVHLELGQDVREPASGWLR